MHKSLKYNVILGVCILLSHLSFAQVNIIPVPAEVVMGPASDSFVLTAQTRLVVQDKSLQPSADFLNEYLQQVYGFRLKTGKKASAQNAIVLTLEKGVQDSSGAYQLEVGQNNMAIRAKEQRGVFYGMQSLLQLLPVGKTAALKVPSVKIKDAPQLQYRGIMLDVSRHFFPVSFVKKYIDYAAFHKLNYFHWHLTEDQGWRIEIKRYPKLTSIGAYRNGTIIDHYPGTGNDNQRYGGFYTQEEIKDIVQYAARRYVTVVPEIEMPGHSSAAIAAYPSLSCFPTEPTQIPKTTPATGGYQGIKKVQETWGVFNDVYCAGNDSTFVFLQNVLDEVLALFPSRYIHIGGDECPKANWKRCPKCQKRISELGLKDEHELQSFFVQRMEKYLNSKGRTIIGWDEILEGGLAPNAVVMSWRGEKGGIEAAKLKHDVIMTPNGYLYFDHYQGKPSEEPLAIGGYTPLSKVYAYHPIPKELTAEEAKYIKGIQANLWTEYVPTTSQAEYMIMPRMAALSEVAWSAPSRRNWEDFSRRMKKQYLRYDAMQINYAKSADYVRQTALIEAVESKATITFAIDSYAPQIYYTLDGSEPSVNATLYTKPIVIRKSAVVKAASFKEGKQVGKTSVQDVVINTGN
jgi:hexosaminidase